MNLSIDRNIQPLILPIRSIDLMAVENLKLDNGLQIHQLNLGTQDLVKIEIIFEAGISFQKQKLVSSFTNKMLAEGTKSFTAYEIAKIFDSYGAYYSANVDKDYASLTLYCLTKFLDQILPVFTEIICEPKFPENELQTLANKTKQEFIVNLKKVKSVAQLNFPALVFGAKHPYGQKAEESDFDKITRQGVQSFYQKNYLNSDSRIFISGKLNKEIIKKLKYYFNKLNIKIDTPDFEPNFKVKQKSGLHHIKVEDALQSAIWVGKKLFNKCDPDFIGMQVLNTILGGYFGSRLMSNIREDKGYTYGINSAIVSHKNDGFFAIQTEVGSKYTDATISEIHKEIALLQSKKINNTELDLIKNYISGQLIRGLDGPFAVHDKLKSAVMFDLDLNYYQHFLDQVLSITPEIIRNLANKHLQKSSLTELIVGK
jgi:predicted Zn-dependent peptidase